MGMSEFYSGRDEAESIATIHRAIDLGSPPRSATCAARTAASLGTSGTPD
jgi:hypothetical protein